MDILIFQQVDVFQIKKLTLVLVFCNLRRAALSRCTIDEHITFQHFSIFYIYIYFQYLSDTCVGYAMLFRVVYCYELYLLGVVYC